MNDRLDIAVLQAEIRRVNERLKMLEEKNEITVAILNKWGGGIAVAIIMLGSAWALISAFSANIQKSLGH